MDGCAMFTFLSSSSWCLFSDDKALLKPAGDAVAGFGVCPPTSEELHKACHTDLPGNGFPGRIGRHSNAAWTSGKQPRSLECWPRNATGGYMGCSEVTVLEDTQKTWPGKCRGLVQLPNTFAGCDTNCQQDPFCASWQTSQFGCYQGVGHNCFVRDTFAAIRAQRLMHGHVRVLWNLTGWQIVGLTKSFGNERGYFQIESDAIEACKKVCYSDIRCQYWQYTPNYGCWVEDASKGYQPPWPLTTTWAYRSTQFALDCVAGEYIQHICPRAQATEVHVLSQAKSFPNCFSVGYLYSPKNMVDQGRTREISAEACQARCNTTHGCAHFAFWPDGGCHLQDNKSVRTVSLDHTVIGGPPSCEVAAPGLPAQGARSKRAVHLVGGEHHEQGEHHRGPNIVQIAVMIGSVNWPALQAHTQELFKEKVVDLIGQTLEVDTKKIRSGPHGHEGSVFVAGSSGIFHWPMLQIVAYTVNNPPSSSNVSWATSQIRSKKFMEALKKAVRVVVEEQKKNSSMAEEVPQFRTSDTLMSTNLTVSQASVTLLAARHVHHGQESDEDSDWHFLARVGYIVLGVLLLIAACAVGIGLFMYQKKPSNKEARKRTVKTSRDLDTVRSTSTRESNPGNSFGSSLASFTDSMLHSQSSAASMKSAEGRPLMSGKGAGKSGPSTPEPRHGFRDFWHAHDPFSGTQPPPTDQQSQSLQGNMQQHHSGFRAWLHADNQSVENQALIAGKGAGVLQPSAQSAHHGFRDFFLGHDSSAGAGPPVAGKGAGKSQPSVPPTHHGFRDFFREHYQHSAVQPLPSDNIAYGQQGDVQQPHHGFREFLHEHNPFATKTGREFAV
mmetsp:Transcript_38826/g.119874  ORF Transcript_38826/g.119874 Transcript_38826/m.119874 type:complete len:835 (-) Transcript_38826:98-2602(-)